MSSNANNKRNSHRMGIQKTLEQNANWQRQVDVRNHKQNDS